MCTCSKKGLRRCGCAHELWAIPRSVASSKRFDPKILGAAILDLSDEKSLEIHGMPTRLGPNPTLTTTMFQGCEARQFGRLLVDERPKLYGCLSSEAQEPLQAEPRHRGDQVDLFLHEFHYFHSNLMENPGYSWLFDPFRSFRCRISHDLHRMGSMTCTSTTWRRKSSSGNEDRVNKSAEN